MERRKEQRLRINRSAAVTVLGSTNGDAMANPPMEGQILEISGTGLRVRVHSAIPYDAPIRVDANDVMMLGEVTRCEPDDDAFIVGIQLSHSLAALPELQKLNETLRALRGEDPWARFPIATVKVE